VLLSSIRSLAFVMATIELISMVFEIVAAVALLMRALTMAGMSAAHLDVVNYSQVHQGLHEVRAMVHAVTKLLASGQHPALLGVSQASGSGGPSLSRVSQAVANSGHCPPRVAQVSECGGPKPALGTMAPPSPGQIVYLIKSVYENKIGRYHDTIECQGLSKSLTTAEPYNVNLLKDHLHLELCSFCQDRRTKSIDV
jgi:hypothetical protein